LQKGGWWLDSPREFSVMAVLHEQTHAPELPDHELAELQRGAEAPRLGSTIRFDPAMRREGAPRGKRGRRQRYIDAAIQRRVTIEVLFGMALPQTRGFVESLLRLTGLDGNAPDFEPRSAVGRRPWPSTSRTGARTARCTC
jgi:hypothetical protein